ncbi:hypothetical protein CC78DRAFT_574046 [Lojkania enalia]|uniref:Uncharacterized protein n=1 Tax=Lojkania enalia TaxID=147567 RepID=A0A9P4NCK4_9PLEO|nr:hypothetical protein CC78DRAFT_574046 [Didymosphaeria enalia]
MLLPFQQNTFLIIPYYRCDIENWLRKLLPVQKHAIEELALLSVYRGILIDLSSLKLFPGLRRVIVWRSNADNAEKRQAMADMIRSYARSGQLSVTFRKIESVNESSRPLPARQELVFRVSFLLSIAISPLQKLMEMYEYELPFIFEYGDVLEI